MSDIFWFYIVTLAGGVFFGVLMAMIGNHLAHRRMRRNAERQFEEARGFIESKLNELMESVSQYQQEQSSPQELIPSRHGQEVSALTFRNTKGKMETVKIVVDYDLTDSDLAEKAKQEGVKKLETGINGCSAAEMQDGKNEFLFSGDFSLRMKRQGRALEDIVRTMLIQQGRMHDV